MKKWLFCLLPACALCLNSCKNTAITNPASPVDLVPAVAANSDAPPPGTPILETPEAYNSYITDRQKKVYDYILQMSDAAVINAAEAISVVDKAAPQIRQLTNEIKAMPPYKGNDAIRDAAIALFEFYETTFNERYHPIINYTKKGDRLTEAEMLQMQKLSTAILTEEKRLNEKFKVMQQLFAEANNMLPLPNSDLYHQVDYLK